MENETPEKTSKTKKTKSNVYQKFFAFKHNLKDNPENKKQIDLLEEQGCFVFYEDEIVNTGDCTSVKHENGKEIKQTAPLNYFKSTVHFVDAETGEEITASSIVRERRTNNAVEDDYTKMSRTYAFKALLGSPNNSKSQFKDDAEPAPTGDNPVSPTPAQTPSEPSGGVPNGFKGFNK